MDSDGVRPDPIGHCAIVPRSVITMLGDDGELAPGTLLKDTGFEAQAFVKPFHVTNPELAESARAVEEKAEADKSLRIETKASKTREKMGTKGHGFVP